MATKEKSENEVWTVANAKAKLSEVIERASNRPQTITSNGRPKVVVVSVEEWKRKTSRSGSLAAFFLQSPLSGSELQVERIDDEPRALDF